MPLPSPHPDARVQRVVDFFEQLQPQDLARLDAVYAPQARFKDPFNEVQGWAAIRAVFEHMYRSLHEPRFVVHEAVAQGDQAFITWDFLFRFQRFDTQTVQRVRGATHLAFDDQGRVVLHRDYWDVAEELYEKLPLVGRLMRWLKAQASR